MEQQNELRAKSREYAGKMLAQKFVRSHFLNAVVVGVPHGGVSVAAAMANRLELPLELMLCRSIEDPSNTSRHIGSVSAGEAYFHDCPYSLPQDYLYFQTIRLRNEIRYDNEFYYGGDGYNSFEGKTVILADDILSSSDALMACIMEMRKQNASKIIVAVPFVEAEAARQIQGVCDELVFIKMQKTIHSPLEFYDEFPVVSDWDVRNLLQSSRLAVVEN